MLPIEETNLDQKTIEFDLRSMYGNQGLEKSKASKAESLKTLPSYLRQYEAGSSIQKLPS